MSAMTSKIAWKVRISDCVWDFLSNPFTIAIYIAFATLCAFVASAKTGIPTYVLMAVGFLLVIFVDPPKRLGKLRARRRPPLRTSHVVPFSRRSDEREKMQGPRGPGDRRRAGNDRSVHRR
ncbi:hypothetical protein BC374_16760 [Ensifer sp. LC13]|nr:hypothetical protein BC374_16760 [Ensifer sp. LC13]OCP12031.1 hypothetical protein BBX50_17560 [Ensifer sp. LC11]